MRFKSKLDKGQLVFDGSMSTPAHWIIDIVSNPWKLGEYVGKAAAELCLFQDISHLSHFWVSFYLSLAIKYYCKRSGRHIDSPSDLKDLTLNNFSSIATWSGRSERPPNSNRIGTAFLTLRMWPEAVESLESGEDLDFNIWTWVGHAYMKMNEFEAAIRAYKRGIATCPESHLGVVREELWRYIGLANWTKGDFKSAIEVFEKTRFAHDVQPYNYDLPPSDPTDIPNVQQVYQTQESRREVKNFDGYPIMLLASAYAAIGDHHGQLRICLGTSQRVNQWWAYQALECAYLSTSNRDYTSTVSDGVSKERAEINHLLYRQNSGHDTTSKFGTLSLDWLITADVDSFPITTPSPTKGPNLFKPWEQITRNGIGWFAIFNRNLPGDFDLSLAHSITHPGQITCLRFSSDGEYLATSCLGEIRVFSVATGRKLATIWRDSTGLSVDYDSDLTFTSDGQFIVSLRHTEFQGNVSIILVDWKSRESRNIVKLDSFAAFSFSTSNGRCHLSVSSHGDGKLKLWTVETGSTVDEFSLKEMPLPGGNNSDRHRYQAVISPDRRLIAVSGLDSTTLVDTKSGSVIALAQDGNTFCKPAFHASGDKLIVLAGTQGPVRLWDLDGILLQGDLLGKQQQPLAKDFSIASTFHNVQVAWAPEHDHAFFIRGDYYGINRPERGYETQLWSVDGTPQFILWTDDITEGEIPQRSTLTWLNRFLSEQ